MVQIGPGITFGAGVRVIPETVATAITSGSLSFSGSNYLSVSNDVALNPGTGSFTIEFWTYLNSRTNNASFWRGNTNGVDIFMNGSGKLALGQAQISTLITDSVNMTTVSWVHVAAVKNGSTITLYKNGVSVGSSGSAPNFVTDTINYIGNQGSFRIRGYMTDLRVVIGVGVYTGTFTPPTSPLTATQNSGTNISAITEGQTQLLLNTTNDANFLKDSSTNNFTVTNTGSVTSSSYEPFTPTPANYVTTGLKLNLDPGNTSSYSGTGTTWTDISDSGLSGTMSAGVTYSSSNGGTMVFSGLSTAVVTINTASAVTSLTNNFTVEVWYTSNNNHPELISTGVGSNGFCFGWFSSTGTAWKVTKYGRIDLTAGAIPQNTTWHQAILTYSSTAGVSVYIDGSLSGSTANTTNLAVSSPATIYIGRLENGYHNGSIGIVRVYNTVLSTTDITQNFNANRSRYGI